MKYDIIIKIFSSWGEGNMSDFKKLNLLEIRNTAIEDLVKYYSQLILAIKL